MNNVCILLYVVPLLSIFSVLQSLHIQRGKLHTSMKLFSICLVNSVCVLKFGVTAMYMWVHPGLKPGWVIWPWTYRILILGLTWTRLHVK